MINLEKRYDVLCIITCKIVCENVDYNFAREMSRTFAERLGGVFHIIPSVKVVLKRCPAEDITGAEEEYGTGYIGTVADYVVREEAQGRTFCVDVYDKCAYVQGCDTYCFHTEDEALAFINGIEKGGAY